MLSLGVLPFCATFAILWAVFRHASCAWIGQDILVRHIFQLMFPFLLLFCVFLYAIFSPKIIVLVIDVVAVASIFYPSVYSARLM